MRRDDLNPDQERRILAELERRRTVYGIWDVITDPQQLLISAALVIVVLIAMLWVAIRRGSEAETRRQPRTAASPTITPVPTPSPTPIPPYPNLLAECRRRFTSQAYICDYFERGCVDTKRAGQARCQELAGDIMTGMRDGFLAGRDYIPLPGK